jgi:hypothetical protein
MMPLKEPKQRKVLYVWKIGIAWLEDTVSMMGREWDHKPITGLKIAKVLGPKGHG